MQCQRRARAAAHVRRRARRVPRVHGVPRDHRLRIRTNNVQERENREIKRRTSSVGVFPSTDALQRLVSAVLMEADEEWSTDRRLWSPENTARVWDAPDAHTQQEQE